MWKWWGMGGRGVERGSRWILFSSFQLLLRGTVADAFLMIFMVLFFRDLGVLYFESECFYHFYSPPRPPTLRSLSCLAIPKCFCCSLSITRPFPFKSFPFTFCHRHFFSISANSQTLSLDSPFSAFLSKPHLCSPFSLLFGLL